MSKQTLLIALLIIKWWEDLHGWAHIEHFLLLASSPYVLHWDKNIYSVIMIMLLVCEGTQQTEGLVVVEVEEGGWGGLLTDSHTERLSSPPAGIGAHANDSADSDSCLFESQTPHHDSSMCTKERGHILDYSVIRVMLNAWDKSEWSSRPQR